jgi:threonine/homoserine/homoserine lactone efflux protein
VGHLVALAFVTLLLVALPGPNVALIIANSLAQGFRAGVITVLGTTAGVLCQLVMVAGTFLVAASLGLAAARRPDQG